MSERAVLAQELEWLMPRAASILFRSVDDPIADFPVIQIRILRRVMEGPATVSGLAHELEVSKAFVSKSVKSLVRKKMVERTQDKDDMRVKTITMTRAGRETMSARSRARIERSARILERIQVEEIHGMVKSLREIVGKAGVGTV